jgi:hypothetical protein
MACVFPSLLKIANPHPFPLPLFQISCFPSQFIFPHFNKLQKFLVSGKTCPIIGTWAAKKKKKKKKKKSA